MVLFPLLDDEILELCDAKSKYSTNDLIAKLEEDLYLLLAILPADEVVVISPTFLFESKICENILVRNKELLEQCFISILMKEDNLVEFNDKKQERYKRVENYQKYKKAYYKKRIKTIQKMPLAKEDKTVSVGTTSFSICIKLLEEEVEKNKISKEVFYDLKCRLIETEKASFLWESVCEQLTKANVPDSIIRKLKIRRIMSQSYLEAYQEEGIILVQNKKFYSIGKFRNMQIYDTLKINRIVSALGIKETILTMTCREFCMLKSNGDYMLAIKKVHDLIQSEKTSEEILQELKQEKVDLQLQNILKINYDFSKEKRKDMVDILIILATIKEEEAITKRGEWEKRKISSGQDYFFKEKGGVGFALARGYEMGESDAAIMAQKFIENLNPKVIAMAGFCAGKRGEVQLGDIIVANKVYNYDIGKQISRTSVLPEISNYSLDGDWLQFIERLGKEWMNNVNIQPPVDFEWQKIELLDTIRKGVSYYEKLHDESKFPNWTKAIEELLDDNFILIEGECLQLTDEGKKFICEYMVKNITNSASKPELLIGPIATGTKVQTWSKIFQLLESKHDRKTCALDMESHVIGKLGSVNKIPFIVVKGVGDYADDKKAFANRFIDYTSYMSCEFIMNLFTMEEFIPYWKNEKRK